MGIGDFVVRALGDAGPGCPEDERGEVLATFEVRDHVVGHCVAFPEVGESRVVAEEGKVVVLHGLDSPCPER